MSPTVYWSAMPPTTKIIVTTSAPGSPTLAQQGLGQQP